MMKTLTAILIAALAAILIAALATTALLTELGGYHIVHAANEYQAMIGYPGEDTYNFCYHTNPEYPDNMAVGMGIAAYYDRSHGDSPPYRYEAARWSFYSGLGWGGSRTRSFYPDDYDSIHNCYCWWKINGIWNQHYYDADAYPAWDGSGINQFSMTDWYPNEHGYPYYFIPNYATTICGKVGQVFWLGNYPPWIYYLDVQVQPFDIVTASPGDPTPTSGPIYP